MVTTRKPWMDQGRVKATLPEADLRDIGWVPGDQLVVRNEGNHLTVTPLPEVEDPEALAGETDE